MTLIFPAAASERPGTLGSGEVSRVITVSKGFPLHIAIQNDGGFANLSNYSRSTL